MKVISIDCGVVNTALTVVEVVGSSYAYLGLFLVGLTGKLPSDTNNTMIRQLTLLYQQLLSDVKVIVGDDEALVLLEQQPHINRTSCLVHDVISSVFYQFDQLNVHPSCKNTLVVPIDGVTMSIGSFGDKGRPQKKLTKAIAREELRWHASEEVQYQYERQKKKDDLADAIAQFRWWYNHQPQGKLVSSSN